MCQQVCAIHNQMLYVKDFISQLAMHFVFILVMISPSIMLFNHVGNIAELINSALATALHAARSTTHCTLRMTPGGIVFNRDMF
jgi:hypothetical protein